MLLHPHWTTKELLGSITLLPVTTAGAPPPLWDVPILGVGWTLKYEVYFYAFFAVSLLFGRLRWWAFAGWAVLTLVLLPGWGGLDRWSPSADLGFASSPLRLITNPIVLLFVIGAGIGLLYGRITWSRITVLPAVLLVALQWATRWRVGNGVFECGLTLIPLMLVFCFSAPNVPAWLVWLGNVSFSLYLFHPLMQEGFDRLFTVSGAPAMVITTGLSLLAAWASYELLERGLCVRLQALFLTRSSRTTNTA